MMNKEPITESEHWGAIEELGRLYSITLDQKIKIAQEKLIVDVSKKFNVIIGHNSPPGYVTRPDDYPQAPVGYKWYWDWYHEKRNEELKIVYNSSSCASCPLGEFIDRGVKCNILGITEPLQHGCAAMLLGHNKYDIISKIAIYGSDVLQVWSESQSHK